jgi:hypothetical protein
LFVFVSAADREWTQSARAILAADNDETALLFSGF